MRRAKQCWRSCCWWPLNLLDLPAGAFDGGACALGDVYSLDRHGASHGAGQDDTRTLGLLRNQVGGFQACKVDGVALDFCKLGQAHFSNQWRNFRAEADFRQAALQRHLAAFETNLVVAALARALALDAAAAGLALAGGGAATDAQSDFLAARRGRDVIQTHGYASSTFNRCPEARIMPRTSGVSTTVAVSRMRRRPSPRTVARWDFSCPKTLFTSVTLICFALDMAINSGSLRRACRASRRSRRATACW